LIEGLFMTQEESSELIRLAIRRSGGPTVLSNLLGISNGAVHSWIRKGRIANILYAQKVLELSNIPVEQLRPCE